MNHKILVSMAAILAAGPALSQQLDYTLSAGVAMSDNIERSAPGSERSASSAVAGVEVRGARPTGRLRYDIAADLAYYDYFSSGIDSEVLGRALASGSYDFVPDTFSWNASANYDQISADPFRPMAPGNTEDMLSVSTGPTLRARFSNVLEGQLDGHYVRTSYGERPFDNETVGGRVLLARRANPRTMLALGASYDDVSYVSSLGTSGLDYDRNELFGRVELRGARTEIQLETGYSDVSGKSFSGDGMMLRARLSRRLTPRLTAFVNGVREYPTSETTGLTADPTIAGGGSYDNNLLTAGPRLSVSYSGGLRFASPRTEADLSYLTRKEESLLLAAGDRDYDELRGRVTRHFTPRMQGSVFAVRTSEDFSFSAESFDDTVFGAEIGISFGRALGLQLRAEHRDRDGISRATGYSEMSGGVFLRYTPNGTSDAL